MLFDMRHVVSITTPVPFGGISCYCRFTRCWVKVL